MNEFITMMGGHTALHAVSSRPSSGGVAQSDATVDEGTFHDELARAMRDVHPNADQFDNASFTDAEEQKSSSDGHLNDTASHPDNGPVTSANAPGDAQVIPVDVPLAGHRSHRLIGADPEGVLANHRGIQRVMVPSGNQAGSSPGVTEPASSQLDPSTGEASVPAKGISSIGEGTSGPPLSTLHAHTQRPAFSQATGMRNVLTEASQAHSQPVRTVQIDTTGALSQNAGDQSAARTFLLDAHITDGAPRVIDGPNGQTAGSQTVTGSWPQTPPSGMVTEPSNTGVSNSTSSPDIDLPVTSLLGAARSTKGAPKTDGPFRPGHSDETVPVRGGVTDIDSEDASTGSARRMRGGSALQSVSSAPSAEITPRGKANPLRALGVERSAPHEATPRNIAPLSLRNDGSARPDEPLRPRPMPTSLLENGGEQPTLGGATGALVRGSGSAEIAEARPIFAEGNRFSPTLHEALTPIVRDIVRAGDGTIRSMRLQVHPEHLGDLDVRIAIEQGVLSARFTAQSEQVRALIEAALPELRQHLQQQGVAVDQLFVFVGEQGHEGTRHERAYGERSTPTRTRDPVQSEGIASDPIQERSGGRLFHGGSIDVVV